MRCVAALSLCLLAPLSVAAKPSQVPVDEFRGDRWEMVAQAGTSASDVNRIMRCPPPHCVRTRAKRKKWKPQPRKPEPGYVRPLARIPVPITPVPRGRPHGAPEADEEAAAENGVWNTIAVALNMLEAPRVLRGPPPQTCSRGNIFRGFVCELERALPTRGVSLDGVVPPLAAMGRQLMADCNARIVSAVRRTYVRGSGRRSLHWDGKALDITSPRPSCLYQALARAKWPGGMSTDYSAVRHLHLSYGGREHGRRFVHYRGGVKRTRYAKRWKRQRYASAR